MSSDLGAFDPQPFANGLRRLNERERRRTATRADAARLEAQLLADRIAVAVPGVRRIYLFGSLLEDVPANLAFDIDLAVEGGDIYAAMEVCEASDWKVDLVDLERVTASVADRIRRTGRLLYGK